MSYLPMRFAVWILGLVIFPIPPALLNWSFQVEVLQHLSARAMRGACSETEPIRVDATERVLLYLESAEKKEIDPWLRDDYRIAWITTKWSRDGIPEWSLWSLDPHCSPFVAATWQVLHCHPDEVWPRIVARREAMLRGEYKDFFGGASSPRKPVRAVTLEEVARRRAACCKRSGKNTNGARATNPCAAISKGDTANDSCIVSRTLPQTGCLV